MFGFVFARFEYEEIRYRSFGRLYIIPTKRGGFITTTEELIRRAAEKSGLYIYEMRQALDGLTDAIIEAVAEGEDVKVHGFGVFYAKACAARVGFNPTTREAVQIPACARPAFKPKKRFVDAVKNTGRGQ